jgi:hypothetical protein
MDAGVMFGQVFRTRCAKCGDVQVHHNTPLETVRMNTCPTCHVRTVVIGHEAQDRTPKNFETGGLLDAEDEIARRLFEAAFAQKGNDGGS